MCFYLLEGALIFPIIFIFPLKYLTKRARPVRMPQVTRHCDMRTHEGNQPSFPSGDAAIAAFFFAQYLYVFDFPWLFYIMTPIVMLGRVWMQCHWIGDTILGALGGWLFAFLWFGPKTFGIISYHLFMINY